MSANAFLNSRVDIFPLSLRSNFKNNFLNDSPVHFASSILLFNSLSKTSDHRLPLFLPLPLSLPFLPPPRGPSSTAVTNSWYEMMPSPSMSYILMTAFN